MRKRSVGINVRVSVTEKKKVTMLARKCGLSLSEYLRQRALGYEPGGHPPKEAFLMCWINWMKLQKAVHQQHVPKSALVLTA